MAVQNWFQNSCSADQVSTISETASKNLEIKSSITAKELTHGRFSSDFVEPLKLKYTLYIEILKSLEGLQSNLGIQVLNKDKVIQYIFRDSEMLSILPDLCKLVKEKIGAEAQLFLRVYHSPETSEEHLDLIIRKKDYSDFLSILNELSLLSFELFKNQKPWVHITSDLVKI